MIKKRFKVWNPGTFALGLLLILTAALRAGAPTKRALLIGIDGCRFDALRAAETPHIDRLIEAGALADDTLILGERFRAADTISGPGWSTILTGVWADKHGVKDNDFHDPAFETYPHYFRRIKDTIPKASTASIVDWEPIGKQIVTAADKSLVLPGGNFYLDGDKHVADEAIALLAHTDPTALFLYFAQVDASGHRNGFHLAMPGYRHAIEQVDAHIGRVVEALSARQDPASEDWLIMVTSDHGGKGFKHGGGHDQPEVIHSFLIVSGASAARGKIQRQTYLVDIVPTLLTHLGVRLDPEWQLDGRPVGLEERKPESGGRKHGQERL